MFHCRRAALPEHGNIRAGDRSLSSKSNSSPTVALSLADFVRPSHTTEQSGTRTRRTALAGPGQSQSQNRVLGGGREHFAVCIYYPHVSLTGEGKEMVPETPPI